MYLGVDVGGTKVEAASVVDGALRVSDRLPTASSYKRLLDDVEALCRAITEDSAGLHGVGIGVPGQASEDRVEWVPNVHCLDGRDLAGDLSTRLECPVHVANDAQLALLGEAWRGAARDTSSAVLFSIGTGVGGALLLDGKIVRGSRGGAGALGWLNLNLGHTPDPDHGWLELHASGRALAATGTEFDPPRTPEQIVADARAGEPSCTRVLDDAARALGVASASIASVLDPEVVLFSGGLVDAFDLLEAPLQAAFREHASPVVCETPLSAAALGATANLWGAIRAAELSSPT